MGLSLYDAMKRVASNFITDRTNPGGKPPELPEHEKVEFMGSLGFSPPAHGSKVTVQDARQGIQDVLKGNIALTSNQQENARFSVYEGEAWGVSTEVDFITGTIKYRWAFKPDFNSKHYEVLIFRTEGSEFPDDYPFKHGHTNPFVQTHLKQGEQSLDSKLGSSYTHTAVLRDRRSGKGADPLRFVTKVFSMEDWENLNDAASHLKNERPARTASPEDPFKQDREKQKRRDESQQLLQAELDLVKMKEEQGLYTHKDDAEREREKSRIRHHQRLKQANLL